MFELLKAKSKQISVTGLGYVGLPLALALAKKYKVIGFDINSGRVEQMRKGIDPSNELPTEAFENVDISFTSSAEDLGSADFHIVCVPTDIHADSSPNLEPLKASSESIAKILKPGDFVIYESTVFPGCTEEICLPILQKHSGLSLSEENELNGINLGYSPERIVPGKLSKKLHEITKIVSGHHIACREQISKVYAEILDSPVFPAPSIKVAEAAKVLENTQRDLNISLMNEMAIICDKLGIATSDVIEAAGTKWNFHKYKPGLVGGHCISVDPFFLISKSKELGYDPDVISAGRRVNELLPSYIAKRIEAALVTAGLAVVGAKVLVMGVTFKEDVSDIRNSKVGDLIRELELCGLEVDVMDPEASEQEVELVFGKKLMPAPQGPYDVAIVAVAHQIYKVKDIGFFTSNLKAPYLLFDLKGIYKSSDYKEFSTYWKL